MALGKAQVNITANLKPLKAGLAQARGLVVSMVKQAGGVMKTGFSAAFNAIKMGLRKIISLAKLATAALLGIGVASVKIASDVQETDNLFKISMGSMADEAAAFAREYSASLNLFENDTRKALSTFQLMLTSMGVGEAQAFSMSKELVKLANDIASFRNQKPEEVFLKLQAGITGEAEPLKRLGILVNDNVIKQLALKDATIRTRMAMQGASKELTETEKVTLRYQAILNATVQDQGDMARTINDTANVFRQLWAQIKTTANTIGKELLPYVTDVAITMRDWFVNNQDLIKKWAKVTVDSIVGVINRIREFIELFKMSVKTGDFKPFFGALRKEFEALTKILADLFKKATPYAIELGKAIGEGFWASFRQTKPGKAITDIGQRITAPATLTTGIGERFGAQTEANVARRIIERNRQTGTDMTAKEILQESKRQTKLIRESLGGGIFY